MAKTVGKMQIPIFAKIGAREIEIGGVELDVKITSSGKVVPPSRREFLAALKKVR